jgi:hypothetical protein
MCKQSAIRNLRRLPHQTLAFTNYHPAMVYLFLFRSQLIYKRSENINEIENSQKPLMEGESELNGI